MAYEGPMTLIPGLTASADLSAKQYYFVKVSGDKTVTVCAATTDKPIGILQNDPESGEAAVVASGGVSKVSGDADLTAGNSVGTSADGQAAAYTASDTTKYIVGQVILGNSAAAGLATVAFECAGARTLA
jgi:hypothetical protein